MFLEIDWIRVGNKVKSVISFFLIILALIAFGIIVILHYIRDWIMIPFKFFTRKG